MHGKFVLIFVAGSEHSIIRGTGLSAPLKPGSVPDLARSCRLIALSFDARGGDGVIWA